MKFKHTFNVFVDNFIVTYKLLLYRLIVLVLSLCLYTAVILPFLSSISDTTQVTALADATAQFGTAFVNLDFPAMQTGWVVLKDAFFELIDMLLARAGSVILAVVLIMLVYVIQKFLLGLGNYTAGAMINDRMAMHANSAFLGSIIKNFGKACLYNAIYAPLSFIYGLLTIAAAGGIAAGLWQMGVPVLLIIFAFATTLVFLNVILMVFTSDWLPSLIYGKTTNLKAIAYSFDYTAKGKNFLDILSNYVVLVLLVIAMNVAAVLLTFGAGLLITMPASYIILISFEFVNYCDNNEIKYFMDKNTIVKPEKEPTMTREKFFKGDLEK